MIELKGVISAENTLEANLGLGVDYYKGEKGNDGRDGVDGKDGINGKDGTDQVYIGATPPADEKVKLWVDTSTQTTNPIEWDDVLDKPDIPSEYIKDATVSNNKLTLTKQDDTTVEFAGGSGGVSGYNFTTDTLLTDDEISLIKELSDNRTIPVTIDNELVIDINKNHRLNSVGGNDYYDTIHFTTIKSINHVGNNKHNGLRFQKYYIPLSSSNARKLMVSTSTDQFPENNFIETVNLDYPIDTSKISTGFYDWIIEYAKNPSHSVLITINNSLIVYKTFKSDNQLQLLAFGYGSGFCYYSYGIYFTDNTFTELDSTVTYYNPVSTTFLTENNWQNYITVSGGGDWQSTTDLNNNDLYSATELYLYVKDSNYNNQGRYFNFSRDSYGNSGKLGQDYNGQEFYFDYDTNAPHFYYNGSGLSFSNVNQVYFILYKT